MKFVPFHPSIIDIISKIKFFLIKPISCFVKFKKKKRKKYDRLYSFDLERAYYFISVSSLIFGVVR